MGRDKVELYARIREDHRQLGLGVRALARRHGVHRRMVREALACPVPAPRKTSERVSPVLDSVAALIDAMLREDLDAPRKQRHTSRRIWQRLADEHGMPVSYSYVCRYAGPRRAEIEAEQRAAAGSVAGFVPQAKEPGAEALCGKPHRASYAARANMRRQVRQRLSCRWPQRVCTFS